MKTAIITPTDPRTGISNYSENLAIELLKLDVEISIISPKNSPNKLLTTNDNMEHITPENYDVNDYDVTHFQLGNSPLHEFQFHILGENFKDLKNNPNIVTTVHDARNFDVFNLNCIKCISTGLKSLNSPMTYPYDIVDKAFQEVSNYLIFHNKSALEEYNVRYKLNNKFLRYIPIPAYRVAGMPAQTVETNLEENRFLAPGIISPFKGQDILIKSVSGLDNDMELIFIGQITNNDYCLYLNNLVENLGVGDIVKFKGFVSDDQFIKEIDRAKAVLIPRLISSWLKKSPIYKFRKMLGLDYMISHSSSGVLPKALASGKPVLCSENQGFSDYVDSNRGIMCLDRVESWRNAIKFMIENPNKVIQMSNNSRNFAAETLDPKLIAKKHLSLYQEYSNKKL
jgi:glycosyltransferase involved in cell wall biosynthesis